VLTTGNTQEIVDAMLVNTIDLGLTALPVDEEILRQRRPIKLIARRVCGAALPVSLQTNAALWRLRARGAERIRRSPTMRRADARGRFSGLLDLNPILGPNLRSASWQSQ
jgi:hypothetical protein